MSRGSVTLTGVVGGSFPAITTLAALIFFGERVSALQLVAILAIVVGVALSSMSGAANRLLKDLRSSGAIFAFGAFFFWGIYFALIRIPVEKVGWFLPQYTSSYVGLLIFYLIARYAKDKDVTTKPTLSWLIALTVVLQCIGSMLFNYAISKGETSIVAPIAGSSPAVFVILALCIFREKLNKKQWSGIVVALGGIIGLSLLGG